MKYIINSSFAILIFIYILVSYITKIWFNSLQSMIYKRKSPILFSCKHQRTQTNLTYWLKPTKIKLMFTLLNSNLLEMSKTWRIISMILRHSMSMWRTPTIGNWVWKRSLWLSLKGVQQKRIRLLKSLQYAYNSLRQFKETNLRN